MVAWKSASLSETLSPAVSGPERPPGDIFHPASRSLRRRILAHAIAPGRADLDGVCDFRSGVDLRPGGAAQTNRWLIDWNLRALLVTLYACSLVNTTNLIASYNVDHSHELTGKETRLDTNYLLCLGAAAIPALDRFLSAEMKYAGHVDPTLQERIQDLATGFDISMDHWQSWTLRRARLMQYLKDNGHIWRSPAAAEPARRARCRPRSW